MKAREATEVSISDRWSRYAVEDRSILVGWYSHVGHHGGKPSGQSAQLRNWRQAANVNWTLCLSAVLIKDQVYTGNCFEPPPICSVCQIPLTIQHFMLDCPQFTVKRAKYFTVSSLKDLFYYVSAHVIVDFIKDIGFYNHLWFHTSPSLTLVFLICILLYLNSLSYNLTLLSFIFMFLLSLFSLLLLFVIHFYRS